MSQNCSGYFDRWFQYRVAIYLFWFEDINTNILGYDFTHSPTEWVPGRRDGFKQQEGQWIFWAETEIPSSFKTNRTEWSTQASFPFLELFVYFCFPVKNQQPRGPERPWEEPNIWKHRSILAWRQCGGWSRQLADFFPPWLWWEWLIWQRTKQLVWVPQVESREYSKTEIST